MKTLIGGILILGLGLTGMTYAGADEHEEYDSGYYSYSTPYPDTAGSSFTVRARVTDVQPIMERVALPPEKHCWQEEKTVYQYPDRYRQERFPAHAVLGGIIGGAIGNQIGAGKGRDAATILGALTGIAIGHDAQRQAYRSPGPRKITERHCRVSETYRTRERITGYRVTYRYHGRQFTTRMPYRPGSHIRIAVSVNPLD